MCGLTDKVLKKPCKECPFRRDNALKKTDKPGGSPIGVYLGQIHGPFWLPCHLDSEYEGKNSDPGVVKQCAGAAIFRANIGVDEKMPKQLLKLPVDTERVFSSEAEMYSYYMDVSLEDAKKLLTDETLYKLFMLEMSKINGEHIINH